MPITHLRHAAAEAAPGKERGRDCKAPWRDSSGGGSSPWVSDGGGMGDGREAPQAQVRGAQVGMEGEGGCGHAPELHLPTPGRGVGQLGLGPYLREGIRATCPSPARWSLRAVLGTCPQS